jgi:hypothetical protein
VLQRIKDAKEEWELQAKAVRAGEKDSPLAMLEKRGYVHLIAGYIWSVLGNYPC